MIIRIAVMSLIAGLMVVLGGCGGGGTGLSSAETASVEGIVYAPAASTRSVELAAAGPGPGGGMGEPAEGCLVIVERARDRQRLQTTTTGAGGAYAVEGLALGEDVLIQAELPSGEKLRARLRLQYQHQNCDVNEDTTMAAAVRQVLDEAGGAPAAGDPLDESVGELCYEYQYQHRYQYGHHNGNGPDFSEPDAVTEAAVDLLAAATDAAVGTALQTRLRADCGNAVDMIVARLRQRERMEFSWDAETRTQAALAMQSGWQGTPEQVADAASGVPGCQASAGDVVQARDRLRERIREFQGVSLEAPEALGCLCLGDPDMDPLRLRTRDQVRECLDALIAG